MADYVRFRPDYPAALFDCLREETGLDPTWPIADVGSGTGIFSRSLLENGNGVLGVEPNAAMRHAAQEYLEGFARFESVPGSAEATSLPDASVRLITLAQAFHWFDPEPTRREFERILEPPGWVALVWNTRRNDASGFMQDYEALLIEDGVDYTGVDHRSARSRIQGFLGDHLSRSFDHSHLLTLEEVTGRMLSASYVPGPDHPGRASIVRRLEGVFERHAHDGRIRFIYRAELYLAAILPPG